MLKQQKWVTRFEHELTLVFNKIIVVNSIDKVTQRCRTLMVNFISKYRITSSTFFFTKFIVEKFTKLVYSQRHLAPLILRRCGDKLVFTGT